jgi:hypothetical protein
MSTSSPREHDLFYGLGGAGGTAALVAIRSGGADALAGALVVIGLLALARKVIRTAGGSGPDDVEHQERRPLLPS